MRKKLCLLLFISITVAAAHAAQQAATYRDKDSAAIVLIPFEFKQSALYHAFTFEVIDSVVNILLSKTDVTLTIRGYAHADEGSDNICRYLSEDRALFVRNYILGRGVEDKRIALVEGMGKAGSKNTNINAAGKVLNCRAELQLNFPPPPPPPVIADRDYDGIADTADACADVYGYTDKNGCPDSAIVVPFGTQQTWLSGDTYNVLDSVVHLLQQYPAYTIIIQGHAYADEGVPSYCKQAADERAFIVQRYLYSRNIAAGRVTAVINLQCTRPLNAGKNPIDISRNARAQIILLKN
jgi:outer membrane protein OmpA-like peptidoglycan-associated protein